MPAAKFILLISGVFSAMSSIAGNDAKILREIYTADTIYQKYYGCKKLEYSILAFKYFILFDCLWQKVFNSLEDANDISCMIW